MAGAGALVGAASTVSARSAALSSAGPGAASAGSGRGLRRIVIAVSSASAGPPAMGVSEPRGREVSGGRRAVRSGGPGSAAAGDQLGVASCVGAGSAGDCQARVGMSCLGMPGAGAPGAA